MRRSNNFHLNLIFIIAFTTLISTNVLAQTKYILYLTYKLPSDTNKINDASNLESECTNKHAVCLQACQVGDGKSDCQSRCEQAFRQCMLGINGVSFWLATCKEGSCETVNELIKLTREEVLDSRLNDVFNEIKPGYYFKIGTYVTISNDNYTFRRTVDDSEFSFIDSSIIGQVIGNYNKDANKGALYSAIENNQESLMRSLLSRGEDVNGSGKFSNIYMPIDIAQKMEKWDLIKELVIKYNVDVNKSGSYIGNGTGLNVLQRATEKNDLELVKFLIDHGAKSDGHGSTVGTPLGIALRNNNIPIIEFLIDQGADVSGRYFSGESFLGQVAARGNFLLLKKFIQNGADVNIEDYTGTTPLDLAVKYNHKEVAAYLRSKGAKNH